MPDTCNLAPEAPRRPVLRYHGGKWRLASWILGHFPPHRVYVEPYGGAASLLLRKPRVHAEVYNDLDEEVVGLFRVLRDPAQAAALAAALALTPFARAEFEAAYEVSADPLERARRLVVRSFMGFGSESIRSDYRTGFRSNSSLSRATPAVEWTNFPEALLVTAQRLRGVVIENAPALEVMARHDSPDTLHYVDPPYLGETRGHNGRRRGGTYHVYKHEMAQADHEALAEALHGLEGMVVLSGYRSILYDNLFDDWDRVEKRSLADGARERTECLWRNPAAVAGPLRHGLWCPARATGAHA